MRISRPRAAALWHEFVYGQPGFPGRARGSRFATIAFSTVAVDRRDLASNYINALTRLTLEQRTIFRQKVLKHKLLRWLVRRMTPVPESLTHYHFRKTLQPAEMRDFVADLNTALGGEIFACDEAGRFYLKDALPAATPPAEEEAARPRTLEIALPEILARSRPLTHDLLKTALADARLSFTNASLSSTLRELTASDIVKRTHDDRLYLASREETHLLSGELVAVLGRDKLTSLPAIESRQGKSRLAKVTTFSEAERKVAKTYGEVDYLKSRPNQFMAYYSANEKVTYLEVTGLEGIQAQEKFLIGLTRAGEKVAVANNKASRDKHHDLLFNHEFFRLISVLQAKLQISAEDARQTAEDLTAAARQATDSPAYLSLYRARKVIEMGGNIRLAIAAIMCQAACDDREIIDFQKIRTWRFDKETPRQDYVDYFIRMQRQAVNDLDAIQLFLATRIAQAVYAPEFPDASARKNFWEEISCLCAPLAAQNLFDDFAALFRDLSLMHTDPDKFIGEAVTFQHNTGLNRREAKAFLREIVAPELKRKCLEWFPELREDEIEILFRAKAYSSCAAKSRTIRDYLGLRIIVKCQTENPDESERVSFALAKRLKEKLIAELLTAHDVISIEDNTPGSAGNVRDHLTVPRPSGWQGLKIYGWHPCPGKEQKEIEVITQTEQMYRLEKVADLAQAWWIRYVNREFHQEFEPLPQIIVSQLTTDPYKNFRILQEYDRDHIFVRLAVQKTTLSACFGLRQSVDPAAIYEIPIKLPLPRKASERQRPTAHDIFAVSAFTAEQSLLRLAQTDVLRPGTDPRTLVAGKKTKDAPGPIQSGDTLIFRLRPDLAGVNIGNLIAQANQILGTAAYRETKLKAWQARWERQLREAPSTKCASLEREYQALLETGKQALLARLISVTTRRSSLGYHEAARANEEILSWSAAALSFKQTNDLYLAAALQYLDQHAIDDSLTLALDKYGHSYKVTSEVTSAGSGLLRLEIRLGDRKGITRRLYEYGILTNANLRAYETSSYFVHKQRRAQFEIVLASDHPLEERALTACLHSFGAEARSMTTTQTTDRSLPLLSLLPLTLQPNDQGAWASLSSVVEVIQDHPSTMLSDAVLPLCQPGEQVVGHVKVEVPQAILDDEGKRLSLFRQLEAAGAMVWAD